MAELLHCQHFSKTENCKYGSACEYHHPLDMREEVSINALSLLIGEVISEGLPEEEIVGLREMFQSMHTDSSGAITFEELKAGLRRYGLNLKDVEIRDLMDAADIDNSGTIDYGKFIPATIHIEKLEHDERLGCRISDFLQRWKRICEQK